LFADGSWNDFYCAADMKTILKFDTGADGFKKMMVVLAVVAVFLLAVGAYFLNVVGKELKSIS
jgi:hypothetical protein